MKNEYNFDTGLIKKIKSDKLRFYIFSLFDHITNSKDTEEHKINETTLLTLIAEEIICQQH